MSFESAAEQISDCAEVPFTRAELARLVPMVPRRTLRFLQFYVDTVVDEFSAPMLRQPTLVDALGFMDRWLSVATLARNGALRVLWTDAAKNPHLLRELEGSPARVMSLVTSRGPEVFGEEGAALVAEALAATVKTNAEFFDLIREARDLDRMWVVDSSVPPGLERLASRMDTLTVIAAHLLERETTEPRPPWIHEFGAVVLDATQEHGRAVGRYITNARRTIADSIAERPQRDADLDVVAAFYDLGEPTLASNVRWFLAQRHDLLDLVLAAREPITELFGTVRPHLSLQSLDASDVYLSMRIGVPNDADVSALQTKFDETWWDERAGEVMGTLVIRVRRA